MLLSISTFLGTSRVILPGHVKGMAGSVRTVWGAIYTQDLTLRCWPGNILFPSTLFFLPHSFGLTVPRCPLTICLLSSLTPSPGHPQSEA
jgi:hypothetical protein